jgi:hypothetical protein
MAIQIQYNTKFGDSYATAYTRIVEIKIDYVNQKATALVAIYKNEKARNEKMTPVAVESHVFKDNEFKVMFAELLSAKDDDKINPVKSIYDSLVNTEGEDFTKYKEGKKVFDTDFAGKEVSKEEVLDKEEEKEEEKEEGKK